MIWLMIFQMVAGTITCDWFTDFNDAFSHAKENEKKVLMVFAGSDWCRPCIRFKETILMDKDFQAYAKENVDILYLDFPAKKKNRLSEDQTTHNEELADQYNKSGLFPQILLFNNEREILKQLNFSDQSTTTFIKEISE